MEDHDTLKDVELIGLYTVEENPAVTLVELFIRKKVDELDLSQFTQAIDNLPRDSWQAPFLERYLDAAGEKIIGDDFDSPHVLSENTRITFFIYYLDVSKPLLTPFGELLLKVKTNPPQRIKEIISFEDPE